MTEAVHLQWIYSMHECAGIHNAMTALTGLQHKTSEQHIELGASRSTGDCEDVSKVQIWFDQHEPFNSNDT